MAAVDRKKETVNRKAEDAREFVELLAQLTEADKERIKYVMTPDRAAARRCRPAV